MCRLLNGNFVFSCATFLAVVAFWTAGFCSAAAVPQGLFRFRRRSRLVWLSVVCLISPDARRSCKGDGVDVVFGGPARGPCSTSCYAYCCARPQISTPGTVNDEVFEGGGSEAEFAREADGAKLSSRRRKISSDGPSPARLTLTTASDLCSKYAVNPLTVKALAFREGNLTIREKEMAISLFLSNVACMCSKLT